jgi:hypothetical protein
MMALRENESNERLPLKLVVNISAYDVEYNLSNAMATSLMSQD